MPNLYPTDFYVYAFSRDMQALSSALPDDIQCLSFEALTEFSESCETPRHSHNVLLLLTPESRSDLTTFQKAKHGGGLNCIHVIDAVEEPHTGPLRAQVFLLRQCIDAYSRKLCSTLCDLESLRLQIESLALCREDRRVNSSNVDGGVFVSTIHASRAGDLDLTSTMGSLKFPLNCDSINFWGFSLYIYVPTNASHGDHLIVELSDDDNRNVLNHWHIPGNSDRGINQVKGEWKVFNVNHAAISFDTTLAVSLRVEGAATFRIALTAEPRSISHPGVTPTLAHCTAHLRTCDDVDLSRLETSFLDAIMEFESGKFISINEARFRSEHGSLISIHEDEIQIHPPVDGKTFAVLPVDVETPARFKVSFRIANPSSAPVDFMIGLIPAVTEIEALDFSFEDFLVARSTWVRGSSEASSVAVEWNNKLDKPVNIILATRSHNGKGNAFAWARFGRPYRE